MDDRTCSVDGCDGKHRRNGLCGLHSQRVRRNGEPGEATTLRRTYRGDVCAHDGCDELAAVRGLCRGHHSQTTIGECHCGNPITPKSAKGMCSTCYGRHRVAAFNEKRNRCSFRGCPAMETYGCGGLCAFHNKGGTLRSRAMDGEGHIDANGYRVFQGAAYRSAHFGERLEHRAVMAVMLGRPLAKHENVHHINGVRHDNRPENLELWVRPQPCGQRPSDLVEWVVSEYPELVEAALADRRQLRLIV